MPQFLNKVRAHFFPHSKDVAIIAYFNDYIWY